MTSQSGRVGVTAPLSMEAEVPRSPELAGGLVHCRIHAFMHTTPHPMVTLIAVNPTLGESRIPPSQPPASREDPGMARVGVRASGWSAGHAPCPSQARPESAPLSGPGQAQRARLAAKARGLMKRQDRFTAAGAPRPGVVSA